MQKKVRASFFYVLVFFFVLLNLKCVFQVGGGKVENYSVISLNKECWLEATTVTATLLSCNSNIIKVKTMTNFICFQPVECSISQYLP